MWVVTLDRNCLIDLEEARPAAVHVRAIISRHNGDDFRVRIPGISASEKTSPGGKLSDFRVFQQWLRDLSIAHLEILRPMMYWDVSFWGWCVFPTAAMRQLEADIHAILFPNIELHYSDFVHRRGLAPHDPVDWKWRNAKCDVQGMWCHIRYGGNVFVTSDRNFHKLSKKSHLIQLGAGTILAPADAVLALV